MFTQAEEWAEPLLVLFERPAYSDHRSLVMSVVKTAHWHLVKLFEADNCYKQALEAQGALRASRLVDCQPEEIRVVEHAARQYR
jgi:hypothetical protein